MTLCTIQVDSGRIVMLFSAVKALTSTGLKVLEGLIPYQGSTLYFAAFGELAEQLTDHLDPDQPVKKLSLHGVLVKNQSDFQQTVLLVTRITY